MLRSSRRRAAARARARAHTKHTSQRSSALHYLSSASQSSHLRSVGTARIALEIAGGELARAIVLSRERAAGSLFRERVLRERAAREARATARKIIGCDRVSA